MKKGKFLILGMLALVLALDLVFVGCNNGGGEPYDGPKTIKITGYNSQGITAYNMEIYSEATGTAGWPPAACADQEINGQTITYAVVNWDDHWGNPTPWTGTGKFFIVIECNPPKDSSKDGAKYVYSADGTNATLVDIKDEITTLQWSKFIWLRDYTAG